MTEYVRCTHCREFADSEELFECTFGGCNEQGLCPNCYGTIDGRDLCLHHCDVVEGVGVVELVESRTTAQPACALELAEAA